LVIKVYHNQTKIIEKIRTKINNCGYFFPQWAISIFFVKSFRLLMSPKVTHKFLILISVKLIVKCWQKNATLWIFAFGISYWIDLSPSSLNKYWSPTFSRCTYQFRNYSNYICSLIILKKTLQGSNRLTFFLASI
jgi:uncharacterized membrane protein